MAVPRDLLQSSSRLTPHGPVTPALDSPFEPLIRGREADLPAGFREQFLRRPDEPFRVVLDGVMLEVWYRRALAPLFWLAGKLGILVPRSGVDIPTRLTVRPGRTRSGRPFHVLDRAFDFADGPIRFRTTITYEPEIDHLVESVGPRGFLDTVWRSALIPPGTFTLASAAVAIRVGRRRLWLPNWLWPWLLGRVAFSQVARPADGKVMDIDLRLRHPLLGEVYGYRGTFETRRVPEQDVD